MTYAQQPYLPLYTLTQPPATIARPIGNVSDLTTFTSTGTEYVQLSSLGDVPARYPSLTSVYLGRVSGTVVAVPAAYGIVHTSSGCEMSISAVVDTDSVSGSQFQVSLTLGPIIDPCDLAQLSADVQGIPEARNLRLTVTPPAWPLPHRRRSASARPSPTWWSPTARCRARLTSRSSSPTSSRTAP